MENLDHYTVEEVLRMVEDGELSAEQAFELESAGKARRTLLTQLKSMIESIPDVESEGEQESPQQERRIKVTLLKNIKYNRDRYKIGQEIEIDPKDVEPFIKAGIIKG